MIIEYRMTPFEYSKGNMVRSTPSVVKRTYKDVNSVHQNGSVTYLDGLIPPVIDTTKPEYPIFREFAKSFLIAAIHLAPGEYLEVVDVPRD